MGRQPGEVQEPDETADCTSCGESYPIARARLGYRTCLACGEQSAKLVRHTIVPLHKSNYVVIRDRELLKGINVKGNKNG